MLIAFSKIIEATVYRQRYTLGTICDLWIDYTSWCVRYAVLDLGMWLPGRRIPVLPNTFSDLNWGRLRVASLLDRSQLEDSPAVDATRPFAREMESRLMTHFDWVPYWNPVMPDIHTASRAHENSVNAEVGEEAPQSEMDAELICHLRSMSEWMGCDVIGSDGKCGRLVEAIVDDESWLVRSLVVDIGGLLVGKRVMVASADATIHARGEKAIELDLTRAELEKSPIYDAHSSVNRRLEERLYDYHGRAAQPAKSY